MQKPSKTEKRVVRGLMHVALERECGAFLDRLVEYIEGRRGELSDRDVYNGVLKMNNLFQKHLLADYVNVPNVDKYPRIAYLYSLGLLTDKEISSVSDAGHARIKEYLDELKEEL
ncbi:MAG: hypothetical protein OSJ46_07570 [Duncaniella sp.]|nr:hypothetical protein [Duncaniella sp.]HBI59049.1 hypothetical protein [Porphyromonadaceae bacterium]